MNTNSMLLKNKLLIIALIFSLKGLISLAQNVDPNFKPVIKGIPDISAMHILPDGKIIVGGNISSVGRTPSKAVLKLNPDGTLDNSFQTNIYIIFPARIRTIDVDYNNKVLISASQYKLNGKDEIVRLNPDGSFDNTFSCNLQNILKVGCLSNGKYLIIAGNQLYRINSDGSLDTDFEGYTEPLGFYSGSFKMLNDGKILCATYFSSISCHCTVGKLVRLNTNGSLDSTFKSGTCEDITGSYIYDIETQSDGKIVIGGYFNYYNGQAASGIIRLKSSGEIDSTFSFTISDLLNRNGVNDLEIDNNNKIIACGGCLNINNINKVIRVDNDGNLDDSFNIATFNLPKSTQLPGYTMFKPLIALYNGITYVIGSHLGCNDSKSFGITALDSTGLMIKSFMPEIGGNPIVLDVCKQADGKIIIGGEFSQVDSFYINNIAQFNKDGSLDTIFLKNIGTGTDFEVRSIAIQSDSNIIIGGPFTKINDTYTGLLARLKPDGTLDTNFKANIERQFIANGINRIIVDSSDQILIGGAFEVVNGQIRKGFALLNPDGSLNLSIASDPILTGHDFWITDMDYQSDKKLIVGGYITDEPANHGLLLRLNKNGTVDPNFSNNISNRDIKCLEVLDKDRIIIGDMACDFSAGIIQLDKDGEILDDSSISVSFKSESCARITTVQYPGNDQLIFGGDFNTVNGINKPALVKVSLKGEVDEFFKYDIEGTVTQFFRDDSTHLFVVGTFNRVGNDYDLFSIARIDINFPPRPTDLTGEIASLKSTKSSGINLKWVDHANNETGFSLEKSLDNKLFGKITMTNSNTISYIDQDVEEGKKYYYRVKAFNINGGSSYSDVTEIAYNSVSLNIMSIFKNIQISPNPGNGNIRVTFKDLADSDFKFKIYNISGKLIYSNEFKVTDNDYMVPIDIKAAPSGIYFINIISNDLTKSIKYIMK